MRRAPERQELRPHFPEDQKWREPADFCPGTAWPKPAPGPPPIANPVHASDKVALRGSNTASAQRSPSPTKTAVLGEEGATRGVSKNLLLIKYAADKQQGELSILLKQGQDPNVKEKVEWQPFETTPLFEGAVNGYKRIVRLLIEHGARVDDQVGPGYTPLFNAALNGHDECVRLLIDANARPDIYTETGMAPLYAAAQGGYGDSLVDLLGSKHMTRQVADYAGNGNGATALYIAAQNGHWKCVRELLQAGVSVDPQMSSCGSTPLHIAIFIAQRDDDKPHRDITEMLLTAKADINHKNTAGLTCLDLAKDDQSLIKIVDDEVKRRAAGGGWLH